MRPILRTAIVGATTAATVVGLAACGSDSSSPSSSAAATTGASTPASTTSAATSSAASTSAASSTASSTALVSPAPEGAAIKAGAAKNLPAKVRGFAKGAASSGPATIYSNNDQLVSVSFLPGSNYTTIVTAITKQKTKAGTGYCGSTSEPTNLTCYLKTADGVLNISADSTEAPLGEVVAFANELTATLGTA